MAPLVRKTTSSCCSSRALKLLLVLELLVATQALGHFQTRGEDQPGIQSSNTNLIVNPRLDGCGDSLYLCPNGTYICDVQQCDGVDDCGDGDDEAGCICDIGWFMCDSLKCIEIDKRCDMNQDCQDNTDEEGCVFFSTTTTKPPLSCPSAEQGPKLCDDGVTQACFCDGTVECPTREDEALDNCQPTVNCRHWEWQCSDGSCIADRHRCDGVQHCRDNSDEQYCPDWWYCRNGQVIKLQHRCDGRCHCKDKSDERHCRPWFG